LGHPLTCINFLGKLAEAIVMDPTAERTKSLEEEFNKKKEKYPGFVQGQGSTQKSTIFFSIFLF